MHFETEARSTLICCVCGAAHELTLKETKIKAEKRTTVYIEILIADTEDTSNFVCPNTTSISCFINASNVWPTCLPLWDLNQGLTCQAVEEKLFGALSGSFVVIGQNTESKFSLIQGMASNDVQVFQRNSGGCVEGDQDVATDFFNWLHKDTTNSYS